MKKFFISLILINILAIIFNISFAVDCPAGPGHISTGIWENAGSNHVQRCSECGTILDSSGHNYFSWTTVREATCTSAGMRSRSCGECGATETKQIPATDHNFGPWEQVSAPTCTTDGTEICECYNCGSTQSRRISALGHSAESGWTTNSLYHWKKCSRCGTIVGSQDLHIDSDENGACDVCNYDMIVELTVPTIAKTYIYNGTEQTLEFVNFDDYALLVTNNKRTNVGSQTVTVSIKNKNKYVWATGGTADKTYTFTINRKMISLPSKTDYTYDGTNKVGVATGEGYDRVSDYQAIDAGLYRAIVKPKDNYCWNDGNIGNQTIVWKINEKNVSVTWSTPTDLQYNGLPQSITPSINLGVTGETMNFTYDKHISVGSYTEVANPSSVTGGRAKVSNYNVTNTEAEYRIIEKSINPTMFSFLGESATPKYTYDGTEHKPGVVGKDGDKTLTSDDYTVEYTNNKNVGTATVTIKGKGNYSGTVTFNFEIEKRDLNVTPKAGQGKMIGVNDAVLEFTYSNNLPSEIPIFRGKLGRTSGETAGTYPISIGTLELVNNGLFLAANYKIAFTAGVNFEIKDYDCMELVFTIPAGGRLDLPIPQNGENDFVVSWGDGKSDKYKGTGFPTHSYTSTMPTDYTVRIAGTVDTIGFVGNAEVTASNLYSKYYLFTQYLKSISKFGKINARRISFSQCKNLVGPIPTPSGFEMLTSVENMFYGCEKLNGEIPVGFFKDLSKIRSAKNVFYGCKLLSGNINSSLFEGCSGIISFEDAFRGCIALTGAIPETLFKDSVEAQSFAGVFNGCTNITSIPEKLFEKNIHVGSFAEAFSGCVKIVNVPENLFLQNKYASNFYRTFYGTKITSVPADLFSNNIVTIISNDASSTKDYRETFANCTEITSLNLNVYLIGMEMFKNCSKIESATLPFASQIGNYAFDACNKLNTIKIGNETLSEIGEYSFRYTGTNPSVLVTYINKNNDMLVSYDWTNSKRKIDIEAPTGYVEIVSGKYPYTNTTSVQLKITVEEDPVENGIEIAILNDKMYSIPSQEEIDNIGEDTSLDIFNWEPYTQNKTWTLTDIEGVRTVYVYFRDKMGNISNVAVDL